MGYIVHDYILITHWDCEELKKVHKEICRIWKKYFDTSSVSSVIHSPINGYGTILICPDGSKEGWTESNYGDAARADILNYLKKQKIKSLKISHTEEDDITFKIEG
jgi:hypothetical protein